jgi:hypothetical protein
LSRRGNRLHQGITSFATVYSLWRVALEPERASSGAAASYVPLMVTVSASRFCSIFWKSDPEKQIDGCFIIDPFVDFDFVCPAQLPDLVFDLFQINIFHYGYHKYNTYNHLDNWEYYA